MTLLEIRFHGRGGQGIVVGSGILGMAFFHMGNHIQFFPEFGVERRGAPVQAFLRVSENRIRTRYNIYEPDHIILFDSRLLKTVNIVKGLKPGGWILINSKKAPHDFLFDGSCRIATVDADGISLKYGLGNEVSPIINSAIAGAYAGLVDNLKIEAVVDSIKESVPAKIDKNIDAAHEAYGKVIMR
jgi:2-oxoacid:acceptor oxidoreductase gamma subunit (pyruvate/2-ketoisovalerate family)